MAEFAESPWSVEAMAAKYGDRADGARPPAGATMLRPPLATLVLGPRGASIRRDAPPPPSSSSPLWQQLQYVYSGSASEPPVQQPPPLPAAPRDSGIIGNLLALLPPGEVSRCTAATYLT